MNATHFILNTEYAVVNVAEIYKLHENPSILMRIRTWKDRQIARRRDG